uniref:Uncharacterized protein n=1 Tax=Fagus sylvatica TaxID=28930 RepID=A0A2N9IDG1_FAGSY
MKFWYRVFQTRGGFGSGVGGSYPTESGLQSPNPLTVIKVVGSGGSVNRFWRTGRSGFAAQIDEISPDPARSLQIRRDLTRSGEVSPDLEPLRGGERFGGADRTVTSSDLEPLRGGERFGGADRTVWRCRSDSVAVEIDVICGDGDRRCGGGDRTTPAVEIQGFFL